MSNLKKIANPLCTPQPCNASAGLKEKIIKMRYTHGMSIKNHSANSTLKIRVCPKCWVLPSLSLLLSSTQS
jgi:hypothetical protein